MQRYDIRCQKPFSTAIVWNHRLTLITMKYLLTFAIVLTSFFGFAQSSTMVSYLDSQFKIVEKEKEAAFTRSLTHLSDSIYLAVIQDQNGKLKSEGVYVFTQERFVEHGEFIFYHSNGQVESIGYYELGIKTGEWDRYTSTGARKASRYYDPESAAMIRHAMKD